MIWGAHPYFWKHPYGEVMLIKIHTLHYLKINGLKMLFPFGVAYFQRRAVSSQRFQYRVSINHPVGFKIGTLWKVLL